MDTKTLRLQNDFIPEMKRFATLFLQMAPAPVIMEAIGNIPDWPASEGQERLYSALCRLYTYPLSLKYVQYFNKLVTRQIEDSGHYWQEDLAELILGFSCEGCVQLDGDCFAGFLLPKSSGQGSDVICCGVQRAHNLVGMRTWGAGMLWCEIFFNCGELFKDMCVLELGSGVGMTGLVAARSHGPPASVIMTDFTHDVLQNLQRNIDLDAETGGERSTFVHSCKLDWNDVCKGTWRESITANAQHQRCVDAITDFDVLLAADCTYSEDIATALLATIEVFLTQNPRENACALVASCIRSMETWMHFVHSVRASAVLDHYHISDWGHSFGGLGSAGVGNPSGRAQFFCEDRERIRMYCLVLKGRPLPSFLTANAVDSSATYFETEV